MSWGTIVYNVLKYFSWIKDLNLSCMLRLLEEIILNVHAATNLDQLSQLPLGQGRCMTFK